MGSFDRRDFLFTEVDLRLKFNQNTVMRWRWSYEVTGGVLTDLKLRIILTDDEV